VPGGDGAGDPGRLVRPLRGILQGASQESPSQPDDTGTMTRKHDRGGYAGTISFDVAA